jgi:hypothetical protein
MMCVGSGSCYLHRIVCEKAVVILQGNKGISGAMDCGRNYRF